MAQRALVMVSSHLINNPSSFWEALYQKEIRGHNAHSNAEQQTMTKAGLESLRDKEESAHREMKTKEDSHQHNWFQRDRNIKETVAWMKWV